VDVYRDKAMGAYIGGAIENANRDYFWYPKLEPLDRIAKGNVSPEDAGWDAPQGGGAAWRTPVGILNPGNPRNAAGMRIQSPLRSVPGWVRSTVNRVSLQTG
jgi:hypothetical protein